MGTGRDTGSWGSATGSATGSGKGEATAMDMPKARVPRILLALIVISGTDDKAEG